MATNALFQFLRQVAAITGALLSGFEDWLRDQLQDLGVPSTAQSMIMIGVTVLLLIGSLRLFAGLIRVAAVMVLVLVVLHLTLPVSHG